MCVHLDGLNAEDQFRVWVTILDNTSHYYYYYYYDDEYGQSQVISPEVGAHVNATLIITTEPSRRRDDRRTNPKQERQVQTTHKSSKKRLLVLNQQCGNITGYRSINQNRFMVLFWTVSIPEFHTNCIAVISRNEMCVEICKEV